MEFNSCILFYSKYSSSSNKLMDYIKTSGVDFTNLIGLQLLCVDNEEIRKRIIENSQIGISSVPCILLIYKDGGVEKYDGNSVFNWCEEIIKNFIKSQPKQTENIRWVSNNSDNYIKERDNINESQTYENNNVNHEYENERLFEEDQKMKESRLPIKTQSKKDSKSVDKSKFTKKVTNLEDIPSENDEEESDRYKSRKPVGRIITDTGNYEDDNELFRSPPNMRKTGDRVAIKESTNLNTQKTSDIMNKAKELAKGREPDPLPPGHPGLKNAVDL